MSALRIDVADLLTHPGARRPVHLEAAVADLGTPVARRFSRFQGRSFQAEAA